jgi:hypothetical protein
VSGFDAGRSFAGVKARRSSEPYQNLKPLDLKYLEHDAWISDPTLSDWDKLRQMLKWENTTNLKEARASLLQKLMRELKLYKAQLDSHGGDVRLQNNVSPLGEGFTKTQKHARKDRQSAIDEKGVSKWLRLELDTISTQLSERDEKIADLEDCLIMEQAKSVEVVQEQEAAAAVAAKRVEKVQEEQEKKVSSTTFELEKAQQRIEELQMQYDRLSVLKTEVEEELLFVCKKHIATLEEQEQRHGGALAEMTTPDLIEQLRDDLAQAHQELSLKHAALEQAKQDNETLKIELEKALHVVKQDVGAQFVNKESETPTPGENEDELKTLRRDLESATKRATLESAAATRLKDLNEKLTEEVSNSKEELREKTASMKHLERETAWISKDLERMHQPKLGKKRLITVMEDGEGPKLSAPVLENRVKVTSEEAAVVLRLFTVRKNSIQKQVEELEEKRTATGHFVTLSRKKLSFDDSIIHAWFVS